MITKNLFPPQPIHTNGQSKLNFIEQNLIKIKLIFCLNIKKNQMNREDKKQWIGTLFFGSMMLFAVRTVMSVCALEISKEFNYDKTQMATLLSCFFYGYPLTQIPAGFLSDRIGGDIIIFYASIVWGSLLGYITLMRSVTGAFQGTHYPSASSLVSKQIIESERAFTFSIITSGQHLG
jgi:MFS transporter, ACS family, solute carrier family 17 (sodium-dependent inorganic phosphate cotransporter), member 9